MSLRQAAMALRAAVPRVAAQAASETGVAAGTTARTLKTSAFPRSYHYVSGSPVGGPETVASRPRFPAMQARAAGGRRSRDQVRLKTSDSADADADRGFDDVCEAPRAQSPPPNAPPQSTKQDYEHGPHSMNFQEWPGRKRKVATWIVGIFVTGVAVPLGAVAYQQSKLKA